VGGAVPDVAEFVAEPDIVTFAKSEIALLKIILETKKAPWGLLSDLLPAIDHVPSISTFVLVEISSTT